MVVIFWVITLPRARPLWKLNKTGEFKVCFLSIADVLHHAYERGRLLHGNICEDNVMWQRTLDGRLSAVVHDWDISCLGDLRSSEVLSATSGRIGTGLYVAVRLQRLAGKIECPERRHHDDLESLLWLLVSAALHFDLENKCRLKSKVSVWEGEWTTAVDAKGSFLSDVDAQNEVAELALEPFDEVMREWVLPLADLFGSARSAAKVRTVKANGKLVQRFDEDRYAAMMTFEAFMQVIGRDGTRSTM